MKVSRCLSQLPDFLLKFVFLELLLHAQFVFSVFPFQFFHFLLEEIDVILLLFTQSMLTPLILQHLQLILVIGLVFSLPLVSFLLGMSVFHLPDLFLIKVNLSLFFVRSLLFFQPLLHIVQLILIVVPLPSVFLVLPFCFVFFFHLADAVRPCRIISHYFVLVFPVVLLTLQLLESFVHLILFFLLASIFDVLFMLFFHLTETIFEIIGLFVTFRVVGVGGEAGDSASEAVSTEAHANFIVSVAIT